ncbi:head-tail connector protein [Brevundimonas mediterranea]|uniref:head-tail connector protein n=1 Tax=Brevundimonas mediterranea TaxID=74329 RepID=UPI004033CDE7
MTPIMTLDEAKAFLRFDSDDEDTLISSLMATATETAMAHADGLAEDDEAPESVKTAALLLMAHWFENREAVNIGNITTMVPLGALWLANRYRKWEV